MNSKQIKSGWLGIGERSVVERYLTILSLWIINGGWYQVLTKVKQSELIFEIIQNYNHLVPS